MNSVPCQGLLSINCTGHIMEVDRKVKPEISYYSDAVHNYMVLECPPELKENYQYKMLAANQIRGLLPCGSRTIDNHDYLYYDITSRQSLTDLYDHRPVRSTDLQDLLDSLAGLEETLTEYLLDGTHLLTDPACIYVDFREQTYSFTYYPGEEQGQNWSELFSFLADRVDGKDKQAAALIYRLCMLAEKPGFRLRTETLQELGMAGRSSQQNRHTYRKDIPFMADGRRKDGRKNRYMTDAPQPSYPPYPSEPAGLPDPFDTYPAPGRERRQRDAYGTFDYDHASAGRRTWEGEDRPGAYGPGAYGYDLWPYEGEPARDRAETGEKTGPASASSATGPGWMPVLSCILMAAGLVVFFLYLWMPMEERGLLLSHAIGAVMIAAGAGILIVFLIRRHRRSSESSDGQSGECGHEGGNHQNLYGGHTQAGDRYGLDPQPEDAADWDPRPLKSGGSFSGDYGGEAFERERFGRNLDPYTGSRLCGSAPPAETCLLGQDPAGGAGLYGTGNYRGEQISLGELPCVVGKMEEYVDHVLHDASVSRMHARFSLERDGKMYVRDLNSTNGTWLNGERLQPNESRPLQTGDHIRLGKMEFVFR